MKKCILLLLVIPFLVINTNCKKFSEAGKPQNVTATVSGNTLTLTWDEVNKAQQYHIYKRMEGYLSTAGAFVEMSAVPTTEVYTEVLSTSGVTTYTYQVVSENKQGAYSDPGTSNSVTH